MVGYFLFYTNPVVRNVAFYPNLVLIAGDFRPMDVSSRMERFVFLGHLEIPLIFLPTRRNSGNGIEL